jgi:hypothetical protein
MEINSLISLSREAERSLQLATRDSVIHSEITSNKFSFLVYRELLNKPIFA